MTIVYQSKIDWWIAALLILGPLASIGLGVFVFSFHRPAGLLTIFVGFFSLILIGLLTLPCRYTLTLTDLKIRCGIIRQEIQLKDIRSI